MRFHFKTPFLLYALFFTALIQCYSQKTSEDSAIQEFYERLEILKPSTKPSMGIAYKDINTAIIDLEKVTNIKMYSLDSEHHNYTGPNTYDIRLWKLWLNQNFKHLKYDEASERFSISSEENGLDYPPKTEYLNMLSDLQIMFYTKEWFRPDLIYLAKELQSLTSIFIDVSKIENEEYSKTIFNTLLKWYFNNKHKLFRNPSTHRIEVKS